MATIYNLDEGEVGLGLERCRSAGLVNARDHAGNGVVPGHGRRWVLTRAGRVEGERLLRAELDTEFRRRGHDVRAELVELYHRFLPLNTELLNVCARWQVRSQDPLQLNDHSNPAYDASVLQQLQEIDGQARQICGQLRGVLKRFSRYGTGFEYALDRIRDGATDWFTKPTLPSYHTLWFELHEDLLATLGLDRAAETVRHQDA